MSTNASITVHCKDGKFRTIYSHWDGYMEHHFPILTQHYNTQEKAEALVAMGDVSKLDESMEKPEGHTFDTPVDGFSIFYGRDRGEKQKDIKCLVCNTFTDCFQKNHQLYNYLFEDGKWSCYNYNCEIIEENS